MPSFLPDAQLATQLGVPALVVLVTVALGLWWRAAQGRVRPGRSPQGRSSGPSPQGPSPQGPTPQDPSAQEHWRRHGVSLGERATFVQVSAPVCAPCRTTARVLGALVDAEGPGLGHHELDVEHHLDLVRERGILRTPTVLVLDAAGTEVARATGALSPGQARAALAVVDRRATSTTSTTSTSSTTSTTSTSSATSTSSTAETAGGTR